MKWKTYTTSINPSLPVLVFSFPPVTSEKGFSSFHVRSQSFHKVSHSVFSHFPFAPAVHPPSSCLISLSSMDPSPPHTNVLCHPLFSDNFSPGFHISHKLPPHFLPYSQLQKLLSTNANFTSTPRHSSISSNLDFPQQSKEKALVRVNYNHLSNPMLIQWQFFQPHLIKSLSFNQSYSLLSSQATLSNPSSLSGCFFLTFFVCFSSST